MFVNKKILAADAECFHDVRPPFTFGASEYLGNAVTCTLTNEGEYKDWVGDNTIFAMWKYAINFDMLLTYNGLSFDYPLWGGSILGPEHLEARKFFEKSFKGRTIDLCLDFFDALGVRVGLDSVSIPTLGDVKEMQGKFAPQMWREGNCLETITYCRGDVRRTYGLLDRIIKGEKLKHQKKDGTIIEFTCTPKLR
jgi:hypothetical protein